MKTKLVFASIVAVVAGFVASAQSAKADTDLRLRINAVLPPAPVVIVSERGRDYVEHVAPRGYWQEVVSRNWIPARWVVSYDRCGREVRVFEQAHYTCQTNRVWVEYGRGHERERYARR